MDSRTFTVYVPYQIVTPRQDGEAQKAIGCGSEIVSVKANKVEGFELPKLLTPAMLAQIRAHIAVEEKVDEEMVWVVGFEYLDPIVDTGEDDGDS